jgi:hypothetical protein
LSPLRSTPGAAAIAAAAASLCLMLSACSGGSATSAANASAPSSGSSASSGSAGSAGSSGSTGSTSSTGSTGSAPGAVSTAGLTGNFCTDFTRLGQSLAKLPKPNITNNVAADQAAARQLISAAEAKFNGLATEAPAAVAAAIHRITALYQTELGMIGTFTTVPQVKKEETRIATDPALLADIKVIVQYMLTKCG